MQGRWQTWRSRLVPDPGLPLEQQFFQTLCFLGGFVALFVVLPMNAWQNLSPWVDRVVFLFGLASLALGWAARKGHYLKATMCLTITACLDLVWFANAGSQGSIGLYFFPEALFLVLFLGGRKRTLGLVLLLVNITGLHLAEFYHPHWVQPFQSPTDRMIDLFTGYLVSLLLCVLMLGVVLAGFNRERQRLEASERLYRDLLERQGEGFSVLDEEDRFVLANPVAERIFGVEPAGLLGRSLVDFLSEEQRGWMQQEPPHRAGADPHTYELEILRPEGGSRTLLVTVTGTSGPLGEEEQAICVFRDITERKEAEKIERMLVQEKQQSQKMESLGLLAGGVAHDFNNMLGGILGYADLLLGSEADPVRLRYLRAIKGAASRSAELTQKLLAFGRRGKNLAEAVDLGLVLRECLDMVRPSMSHDLEVHLELAEGVPTVDGDPSQIHQVFMNLLINAVEARPERGILQVSLGVLEAFPGAPPGLALPPGRYVEARVADTGIGMAPEVQQRVFEPFFTTKNREGRSGTGLGLATAHGIVQVHGGAITVQSARGKGTTFRVLFPAGALAPAAPPPQEGGGRGAGLVLLIEDEEVLRELGVSALESMGYEVATAADGQEGVEAFERLHHRLCAVLLDLKMPRRGGRETFLELRGIDARVPVLICTGYGENEEVQSLLSLGAAGMLAKPYQIATLAAKLRQVMG